MPIKNSNKIGIEIPENGEEESDKSVFIILFMSLKISTENNDKITILVQRSTFVYKILPSDQIRIYERNTFKNFARIFLYGGNSQIGSNKNREK